MSDEDAQNPNEEADADFYNDYPEHDHNKNQK